MVVAVVDVEGGRSDHWRCDDDDDDDEEDDDDDEEEDDDFLCRFFSFLWCFFLCDFLPDLLIRGASKLSNCIFINFTICNLQFNQLELQSAIVLNGAMFEKQQQNLRTMSNDDALRHALLSNRQRPGSGAAASPSKSTPLDTRLDDNRDDVDTGTKFHKRARLGASAAAAASISAWGHSSNESIVPVVAMATVVPVARSIPGPAAIEGRAVVVSASTTSAPIAGGVNDSAAVTSSSSSSSSSSTASTRRSQRRASSSGAPPPPTSGLAAEVENAGDKVFRRGAWLALLEARQLAPFGAAPLIARSATLANVQRDGAWQKAPRLAVFVHRITLTETDAIVVARDPTGQMMGTVHRSVLDDHPLLTAGAALDLKHVPVFAPDVRHRYLNIMPENIERVFLASAQPTNRGVRPLDDPLTAYALDVREDVARRHATEQPASTTPLRAGDAAADRARALLMRSAASARRRQGGPRRGRERTENADNDEMPTPVPRNPLRPTPAASTAVVATPTPAVNARPPTPYQPPRQSAPPPPPPPVQQAASQVQQASQQVARSSLAAFRPAAIVSSLAPSTQQQVVQVQAPSQMAPSQTSGWPAAWPAPPTTNTVQRPPARLTRFDELDDSAFLDLDV
jgi:hypothetical protein